MSKLIINKTSFEIGNTPCALEAIEYYKKAQSLFSSRSKQLRYTYLQACFRCLFELVQEDPTKNRVAYEATYQLAGVVFARYADCPTRIFYLAECINSIIIQANLESTLPDVFQVSKSIMEIGLEDPQKKA